MDLLQILKLLLLFFGNDILSVTCQSSNPEYFSLIRTMNTVPKNPLLQWLIERHPSIKLPFLEYNKSCKPCKCGLPNKKNKIVGGHETSANEYPWMAMLLYNNRFYCGGSLINDRYILTAAHCVDGFQFDKMTVKLLMHLRFDTNPDVIIRKVKNVIVNKRYNRQTFDSDIALLSLNQKVQIDGIMRPICLPNNSYIQMEGRKGTVIGWGTLSEKGPLATSLQEVDISLLNNTDCRRTIIITENMFCAGEIEGEKDSCQGDSGGPMMLLEDNKYIQIGIVSWGYGCAQPNTPGVYTKLSNYLKWIKLNTRDACYC